MSKQSTSFEIGFALGSVVREFRRALVSLNQTSAVESERR